MIIYLAGPIDGVIREDAIGWREFVSKWLYERGVSTYNPAAAFSIVPDFTNGDADAVVDINRRAVCKCDVVLAYLPSDKMTIGTLREIEYARSLNKPVVVVTDIGSRHIYLSDVVCCGTLEEALSYIMRMIYYSREV